MASTEVDWASLPELPLYLISKKLSNYSDVLRFVIVCKAWRGVVVFENNNKKYKWQEDDESCLNHQVPLLMVPSKKSPHNLYRFAGHKPIISSHKLSMPYNFTCSGSSYGWLAFATATDRKNHKYKITLYNPFISQTINDLPLLESKSTYPDYWKVILSANPCVSRQDLYIAAIYHQMHGIALLKYGSKSWTYIDFIDGKQLMLVGDLIFFKGTLYIVKSYRCQIASIVDIKAGSMKEPIFITPTRSEIPSMDDYLVESSQGELLVVRKFSIAEDIENITFEFKVYKIAVSDEKEATLEEVKSLGNDALFIGDNHSMSLSALEFPQCKPDSIYFTTSILDIAGIDYDHEPGLPTTGIYNIKEGNLHRLCEPIPPFKSRMMQPIWIIPTPKFY